MSPRELIVLGTSSLVPTRNRNHNGYLLLWDGEGILFDPGEGTQRQMQMAGVAPPAITHVCVTHFHGDHCLGLPGVLQRLSLDRVARPVDIWFPSEGAEYFERLRHASVYHEYTPVRPHPAVAGPLLSDGPLLLEAVRLDHRIETLGYRVREPDGRRMLPEKLDAAGVRGSDISRLIDAGRIETGGRTVLLDDVSVPRRGQRFAFIMDTRLCDAAFELAQGADLLVCESTYLTQDEDLAREYRHLTAAQAARIAAEAGARKLVLTHFSQRYKDPSLFVEEAAPIFPEVVAARDLDRIAVPRR